MDVPKNNANAGDSGTCDLFVRSVKMEMDGKEVEAKLQIENINRDSMDTVHLVGIAGSGMLPLAELLRKKKYRVTGSDRLLANPAEWEKLASPIRKRLQRLLDLGAELYPQDGSGIGEATARIVISTAIEESNPDWVKAKALRIPIRHRAEELRAQLEDGRMLAVAGTSGKSTTTALCAWLLAGAGELNCFVGGAEILESPGSQIGGSSVHVAEGSWSCVELDESDASLLRFEPDIALVLNISRDHHPLEENLRIFREFSTQVRNTLLLNRSDVGCGRLSEMLGRPDSICWFSPPQEIDPTESGVGFHFAGMRYELPLLGRHNAMNAYAALAAVRAVVPTVPLQAWRDSLKTFPGVRRRLQRYGFGPVAVYDDFAHNPDKIAALLTTLQERYPRVHILFQPHGYGPLRFHLDGFAEVFSTVLRPEDRLILLPVYDAGGTTDRSISSQDLANKIASGSVCAVRAREEALQVLIRSLQKEDAVVVAGARDDTLAEFTAAIEQTLNESATTPVCGG